MLSWAIAFLVVAIIAGVLGFGGIAGAAVGIAKILFFVFFSAVHYLFDRGQKSQAPALTYRFNGRLFEHPGGSWAVHQQENKEFRPMIRIKSDTDAPDSGTKNNFPGLPAFFYKSLWVTYPDI